MPCRLFADGNQTPFGVWLILATPVAVCCLLADFKPLRGLGVDFGGFEVGGGFLPYIWQARLRVPFFALAKSCQVLFQIFSNSCKP